MIQWLFYFPQMWTETIFVNLELMSFFEDNVDL